jgi:hypothetical protein
MIAEPWKDRPTDIASLLNPALGALLITEAVRGYQSERPDQRLDFAVAHLVLPITLHGPTRRNLPSRINTKFHVWLERNPETRIGFAERVRDLVPFTAEGIVFASNQRWLTIIQSRLVRYTNAVSPTAALRPPGGDVRECAKSAYFLGRWLATAGSPNTIYALLGIRP